MKLLLLLFVTALSLLNPIVASPIDPDSNLTPSLEARGPRLGFEEQPHEGSEPQSEPEIAPRPVVGVGQSIGNTYQSIKSAIQRLPGVSWIRYQISKVISFPKLLLIRVKYNVDPKTLYQVEEDGTLMEPEPYDVVDLVRHLKEVPGTGGRIWKLEAKNYEIENDGYGPIYETMYFSPEDAIENFVNEQANLRPRANRWKRDVMQTLNGELNSTQDAADTFEQYLEMFHTVQASVGALIAPVLNNITSQTNSSLVHQMAQSIYYDLTGSTIALIGPFNYGMSFLGNRSTSSTGQGGNNTSTNATESEIQELYTTLENIYTAMWVKSVNAANTTGFFAEQIYLAGCLYTNDTSVYPPGFTTVSKSANSTDTGK